MNGNASLKNAVEKLGLLRKNRKKMYIIGLYGLLVCWGVSRNFVHSTDWLGNVTRFIVEDSGLRTIKILTRLADDEILENPIFEKLFVELMQKVPTTRINFADDFDPPMNSVPDQEMRTMTPVDTSSTLFLIAIESRGSLLLPVTKSFIDVVAKMATFHYRAKYLIVSCGREPSDRVEELLQHAWTKKMLDLTVIELIESQVPRYSILIERPVALPIIHQLNPFNNEYTRAEWNANTDNNLFPNKVNNVWGYPLRIDGSDMQLHGIEDRSEIRVLQTFIQKLNCSPMFTEPPSPTVLRKMQRNPRQVRDDIDSNNIDLTADLYPHFFVGWNDSQRLSTLITDQFCAAVPVMPNSELPTYINLLKGYVVSFGIVLIVWLFLKIFRYRSYSSRMFNIGRVLFGIPVSQQPRDNIQRIVFACLLAVFAVYSTTIYTSITDISLPTDSEMKFESFEDLDNSGLEAFVLASDAMRTADLFNGPLKKLTTGMKPSLDSFWCLRQLVRRRKFICLTSKYMRDAFVSVRAPGRRVMMKFAKPCFWNDHLSFLVGNRSPYRPRLDQLISRLHSSGLVAKTNSWDDQLKLHDRLFSKQKNTNSLFRQLIVVGMIGYGFSIVVLLAEIIFHRISSYKKSKIQPRPQLFPHAERKSWKLKKMVKL